MGEGGPHLRQLPIRSPTSHQRAAPGDANLQLVISKSSLAHKLERMHWIAMAGRVRASAKERRGGVVNSPEKALPPKRRRRLDPEDREREIVEGAVAFFAEVGFDGGLRDLAKRLGMTHQNLFRYFPTKEALIERVYKEVYLNRWQPEWEAVLHDATKPLEGRLIDFYGSYLRAIFRYDWVRIFVFAGLKGVDIT